MEEDPPQCSEHDIDTVLSVASAEFERNFPGLKCVERKDILAVLESCVPGYRFEELECLMTAALYPDLVLDCNKIQLTLKSLAELSESGPVALCKFNFTQNSSLVDPLSAIRNFQQELGRWRYRWRSPAADWERWVNAEEITDSHRDVLRDAYKILDQQFSDIWEVNKRLNERSRAPTPLSGVCRVQCIAEVTAQACDILQTKIAPVLHACKAKLDQLEKLGQDLDHVVIAIEPAGGAMPGVNPFQGNTTVRRQRSGWDRLKEWIASAWREAVIWNQNLQNRANWLALVILLVINPVVWILMAALPFTILSTLLCGMPDAVPAIDSDFYAGLSSTVSGLAGLFAIISSLRRPDPHDKMKKKRWKIESQFPRTFVALLCVSVLSGIASVVVYPWESPWSIPLAFVSNVAQNVATLLIVQGSAQRITELER